jgi:hypothetical protein
MDFGFSRLLEMFEKRFGRTATTVLLAAIGLALFGYCAKTMIETSIYFYHLSATALNIAAIKRRTAATALAQIGQRNFSAVCAAPRLGVTTISRVLIGSATRKRQLGMRIAGARRMAFG